MLYYTISLNALKAKGISFSKLNFPASLCSSLAKDFG